MMPPRRAGRSTDTTEAAMPDSPQQASFPALLKFVHTRILSRWIANLRYAIIDPERDTIYFDTDQADAFRRKIHCLRVGPHHVVFTTGSDRLYGIERAFLDWSMAKIYEYREAPVDFSMCDALELSLSRLLIVACLVLPAYNRRNPWRQLSADVSYFGITGDYYRKNNAVLFSSQEKALMETIHQLLVSTEHFAESTNEGTRFPFTAAFLLGVRKNQGFSLSEIFNNQFMKSLASDKNFFFISENGMFVDYKDISQDMPQEGELQHLVAQMNELPCAAEDQHVLDYIFKSRMNDQHKDLFIVSIKSNSDVLLYKNQTLLFFKRRGCWHFFGFGGLMDTLHDYLGDKHTTYDISSIGLTIMDMLLAPAGCCLGIVKQEDWFNNFEDVTEVGEADYFLSSAPSVNRCFWANSRNIRQKMLNIDGAVLVSAETGGILGIGTIMEHDGSASEGARTTATKHIARLGGLGIKISDDGYCQIYYPVAPEDAKDSKNASGRLGGIRLAFQIGL